MPPVYAYSKIQMNKRQAARCMGLLSALKEQTHAEESAGENDALIDMRCER